MTRFRYRFAVQTEGDYEWKISGRAFVKSGPNLWQFLSSIWFNVPIDKNRPLYMTAVASQAGFDTKTIENGLDTGCLHRAAEARIDSERLQEFYRKAIESGESVHSERFGSDTLTAMFTYMKGEGGEDGMITLCCPEMHYYTK
jgi:hypothetical protein